MREGITVIIPTLGRESLSATLSSLVPQLHPEDAVVVISEGHSQDVKNTVTHCANLHPATDWTYTHDYGGAWGHPNRNYVLDRYVETTHVWTIDDDDVVTPGALDAMRDWMHLDTWVIFRMRFGPGSDHDGLTLPIHRQITDGNIGTPMIFAPFSEARFGHRYMGDIDYAQQLEKMMGPPEWSEEIVAIIRPFPVEE